jgi:predicted acetyltransferase
VSGDQVALVPVTEADKPVLERLVQLYRYDMAPYRGYELDEHGTIPYRYLDHYFLDGDREACFVRHGGNLAGFTMTRALESGERDVAEFFVVRHHRRRGVGARAAGAMFRRHPGDWVLTFDAANPPAAAFWPVVAASVAAGDVTSGPKPPTAAFPGTELRFTVAAHRVS